MAELATVILEFIKFVAPPTRRSVDNHRNFKKYAKEMRKKLRILEAKKEDLKARLQGEVCSEKKATSLVVVWLQDVEKIKAKSQDVLKELPGVSYFSRARLGKRARKIIVELDDILGRCSFSEGLVVNKPNKVMVKDDMGLTEIPDEHEWTEYLEKVSLMKNEISNIPLNMRPNCPNLTTLMLQKNRKLTQIPDCFFANMQGLKLLNLSETSIESLPHSICNLENLTTLLLRYCRQLKHVPCLAKLKALKKLDMFEAGIHVVPEGIDMLVNLQYLDLLCPELAELPTQILGNLSQLQHLTVDPCSTTLKIKGEEVRGLMKLETFQAQLYDLQDFINYVKSNHFKRLSNYQLVVGQVADDFQSSGINLSKEVSLGECEIGGEDSVVLPDDVDDLWIYRCRKFRSFSDIYFLQKTTELRNCFVSECEEIGCVVDKVTSSSSFIYNVEQLCLDKLPNLSVVANVEGIEATPPHIFSNLRLFWMRECSRVKRLFTIELLQGLQNLEQIAVEDCQQMEEIIGWEGEEENHTANATTTTTFTLPKLRELSLENLPELKRICPTRGVMVCDSLQSLEIKECPKLKRIALVGNVRPSPPAALKQIQIKPKELWESLEWDDPNAKNVLEPFVEFPFF